MNVKILLVIGIVVAVVGGILAFTNNAARNDWILGTWEGSSPGNLIMAIGHNVGAQGQETGPWVDATDLEYNLTIEFTRGLSGRFSGKVTVVERYAESTGYVGAFTADAVIRGDAVSLEAQIQTTLSPSSPPVGRATLRLTLARKAEELTGDGSLMVVLLDEHGDEIQVADANGAVAPEGTSRTFREILLQRSAS
jgi:hypothetical protein